MIPKRNRKKTSTKVMFTYRIQPEWRSEIINLIKRLSDGNIKKSI